VTWPRVSAHVTPAIRRPTVGVSRSRHSSPGASHRGCLKLHIRPLQFAKLAGTKPMPETNENYRGVALTVSVFLSGFYKPCDFTFCQMFAWPEFVIGKPSRRYCPFCCCWSHQLQVRVCHMFSPSTNIVCPHSCRRTDSYKFSFVIVYRLDYSPCFISGHFATYVRFTPGSGLNSDVARCRIRANRRHSSLHAP
jgi:hypothetical protein